VTHAMKAASSSRLRNEATVGEPLPVYRRKERARPNLIRKTRNDSGDGAGNGAGEMARDRAGETARNTVATAEEVVRRDVLEEMFVGSRSKFLAIANSILRNREDAEEAVQEAFLSAHCNLRKFEGRSALKTWLTRIVLNAALMMLRKRKPVTVTSLSDTDASSDEDWTENIPDGHPNPEMIHAGRETFELVDGILGKMRPVLRQAFTLTYYDELSREEAAAKLRVSNVTFKARLFRAKRQLLHRTERALATSWPRAAAASSKSWKRTGFQGFREPGL
jgi:RNA polymerase sigma-70 factor (ECF subfamily)